MQLLCLGDVALADQNLSEDVWGTPGAVAPGEDLKVLFNWELAMGDTKNPSPRSSGPRLLAHPDSWRQLAELCGLEPGDEREREEVLKEICR